MQTKFNYTSGGEFKLSDNITDYIGYFNIDDIGQVYTGKYYSENSILLTNSVSEYSSDYHKSDLFKDRFIYDDINLPYSLDQILIQPNELVNYNVLNTKITYLHYNLLYMYSKMFIGGTDTPYDNNVNTLGNLLSSNKFQWNSKLNAKAVSPYYSFKPITNLPNYAQYGEFDNFKKFIVVPFVDNKGVSILGISSTHLIGLTSIIDNEGQLSAPKFVLYTEVIDNYSQEKCINLEDIAYNGKFMYISDSKINGTGQVFKYDITAYYTNDKAFENKVFLDEVIGGYGDIDKKNKFNGCTVVGCKDDEVWIYDSGNNCIKIYNNDLIWKTTLKVDYINGYEVIDIRNRKLNDNVYVLYKNTKDINNTYYGYFEYNSKFKLINTVVFEDKLYELTDGSFNRMCMSQQDSNVFYISTNSSIYKKYFSRPEKTFATFDRDKFFPEDSFVWDIVDINWDDLEGRLWNLSELYAADFSIKDIFVIDSNQNKDDFFILGNNFISHLNENTEYTTVLRNTNIPYYNYNSIKFENMEYNQAVILNKEFYKLFSNIIQFKNFLKGKFYAEYNKYGDLIYKDYIYLSDEEISTIDIELEYNSFINDNELVQANVINRLFNKVYYYQYNLVKISEVKLKNFKTYVDIKLGLNIYPIE